MRKSLALILLGGLTFFSGGCSDSPEPKTASSTERGPEERLSNSTRSLQVESGVRSNSPEGLEVAGPLRAESKTLVYSNVVRHARASLKDETFASRLPDTFSKMVHAEIELEQHLNEAGKLSHEYHGMVSAQVPLAQGQLSYAFWDDKDGTHRSVRQFRKSNSKNQTQLGIIYFRNGKVQSFVAGDEGLAFFEDGQLESWHTKADGTTYSAGWNPDGTVRYETRQSSGEKPGPAESR